MDKLDKQLELQECMDKLYKGFLFVCGAKFDFLSTSNPSSFVIPSYLESVSS